MNDLKENPEKSTSKKWNNDEIQEKKEHFQRTIFQS
jgi:hypothetical protein